MDAQLVKILALVVVWILSTTTWIILMSECFFAASECLFLLIYMLAPAILSSLLIKLQE